MTDLPPRPPAAPDTVAVRTTPVPLAAVPVATALISAIAVLVATMRGPGLNPDSANYLSSGTSLAAGDGLVAFGGARLTLFPPGLPAVVALGDLVGLSPEWTVRLLNAGAFATTVVLAWVLLRRHVRDGWLVVLGTCFVAVGLPLLTMAEMVWTEPTFIALFLGVVIALERAIDEPHRVAWIAAAVGLSWAAIMFRYAGVALVPAGGLALLLGLWRREGLVSALRAGIGFGLAAAVVPIGWMLRNHAVDGTYLGERNPSIDEPIGTVARFVATLGRWLVPPPAPVAVQAAAGVAVVLLGVAWCFVVIRAARRVTAEWAADETAGGALGEPTLVPLVTLFGVYAFYLIVAQLTAAFDQIGNRLMSPLFVPFVVLVVVGVDRLDQHVALARRPEVRRVAAVVLAVVVGVYALLFAAQALESRRDGVGYAERSWQASELGRAVRELPGEDHLYSNAPAGLWVLSGHEPLRSSPAAHARRSDQAVPIPEDFLDDVACGPTYLAWFDDIPGSFLLTPEELDEVVDVEVVAKLDDGALYRLRSEDPGRDCG